MGQHIPDEITENYRLNKLIVAGLLTIALLSVIGSAVIFLMTRTVSEGLVQLTSIVCSGLLGFLSRGYRPTPPSGTQVSTDSGTVNVSTPDATPADSGVTTVTTR